LGKTDTEIGVMNSKHRAGSNRQLWSALDILKSVMLGDDCRALTAP
jgi:hypothetical protein